MTLFELIKLCKKRGGTGHAIIDAIVPKRFKLMKEEARHLENSLGTLRDELLFCYTFLEDHDLLEIYMDDRDGLI